jgi:hypothetical protein
MNEIILMFLFSLLARARTRRDKLKVAMVIMTVPSHQQGLGNIANFRQIMMVRRVPPDDALAVHLLASLRENPTGVNDPHNSDIIRRIIYGNEVQFRRMFRVSRCVFEAVLGEISQFLTDSSSRNSQQNVSARLKLGIALYYMAHGGDAIHLEAASGLSKATALKYLHEVAELICKQLSKKWMAGSLLEENGYMDSCRERFRLRNAFPFVGAAIDGTHVPYKPNSGDVAQSYKNYKMWTSMLCIGMVNSNHMFVDIDVGWPGRLHDKTCTEASRFWKEMHKHRELWLGKDGVALADTAWSGGSELVMTPYTVADGSTESQQWYNFVPFCSKALLALHGGKGAASTHSAHHSLLTRTWGRS